MTKQQVTVPDIGGAEGAEVIELLVAVGDEVTLDQGLIVLESDKASMEIPSTASGTVVELLVAVGDQLAEGAPIALIEVAESGTEDVVSAAAAVEPVAVKPVAVKPVAVEPVAVKPAAVEPVAVKPAAAPAPAKPQSKSEPAPVAEQAVEPESASKSAPVEPEQAADKPVEGASGGGYAGPAVRKLAREFGVDLGRITGSGPRSRILKEDLQQFVQKALGSKSAVPAGGAIPAIPEVDFARFGEVEVTRRSKLDKLTAANMQRNWLNVPHVTQFDDADITDLEEFRSGLKAEAERRGARLTPVAFLLKACAVALRENPKLNSALAAGGEELVYKHYVHIGMAVDTPAGLMVPVIRDVDQKTVWELAAEVQVMAAKARDRKLLPADMQGGCFSISSLGNIGGNGFTPIVNAPEVGILGVSRAAIRPHWDGQSFVPRNMLPLALSYDHRVVNGGDGGRFLSRLVALLEDIRQLVM